MGAYIYKVTSKEVTLDNGEKANVALFAYKPYLWDDAANSRFHFRSGAVTCGRMAAEGKRHRWVVLGYQEHDGTVEVGRTAVELPEPMGSFADGWLDCRIAPMRPDATPLPRATVVGLGKGMRFSGPPKDSPSFAELAART